MIVAEYLRMASRALGANRFRSSLTVFSITTGALAIVFMSSLAKSGLSTLVHDIAELGGARIVMVAPKKAERRAKDAPPPAAWTPEERRAFYDRVPFLESRTTYSTLDRHSARFATGPAFRTDWVAADAGFFDAFQLKVVAGRLWTPEEDRQRARVCVIASKAGQRVPEGAVGRFLSIGAERCRVIGVLAPIDHWDSNFGFAWLDFVAMPLDTVALARPEVLTEAALHLRTDDVAHNEIVKRITNALLVDRRRGVDNFQIWDFNAFMGNLEQVFALLELVVGLLAGIALGVGGIGVMNMMLVSVSERRREIGLRKALGAPPNAILGQFLTEAALLSGGGGLVGAGLGVAAASLANLLLTRLLPSWISNISVTAVLVAILVSIGVGVAFGMWPAQRASRLLPVEAWR